MNKPTTRVFQYRQLPIDVQKRNLIYMQAALTEAKTAGCMLEVPIGCVIVDNNGEIIGRGQNHTIRKKDVLAHAEVEALHDAAFKIGDFRLDNCECFVTIEPCLMCLGALLHARISTIHFGVTEPKFGAVVSRFNLIDHERFSKFLFYSEYLTEEISALLAGFFKDLRTSKSVK